MLYSVADGVVHEGLIMKMNPTEQFIHPALTVSKGLPVLIVFTVAKTCRIFMYNIMCTVKLCLAGRKQM